MRVSFAGLFLSILVGACATSKGFQEKLAAAPKPDDMSCTALAQESAEWAEFSREQAVIAAERKDEGVGVLQTVLLPFVAPVIVVAEPFMWLQGQSGIANMFAGNGLIIQNENDARAARMRVDAINESATRRGCVAPNPS